MSPTEAAEKGFFTRASGDALLADMLGSGRRIFPEWSTEISTPGAYPRLTFYAMGPPPKRPGFQHVRLSVDEWVWYDGVNGGRQRLLDIDARIAELFDEAHWSQGAFRLYSYLGTFRDFPAGPGERIRRLREITIVASPGPVAPEPEDEEE